MCLLGIGFVRSTGRRERCGEVAFRVESSEGKLSSEPNTGSLDALRMTAHCRSLSCAVRRPPRRPSHDPKAPYDFDRSSPGFGEGALSAVAIAGTRRDGSRFRRGVGYAVADVVVGAIQVRVWVKKDFIW